MPAKVALKITEGPLSGQEFAFEGRTTCIIGRAADCEPKLPDDPQHRTVSRHHCLLDINPPDIRVRDFGSKNGTFVNGKVIGRREAHQTPEEGAQGSFPEHDLKFGDTLKLGNTTFRVSVTVPVTCFECGKEIPGQERKLTGNTDGFVPVSCDDCRRKAAPANRPLAPPKPRPKLCAKCGKDVSAEVGEGRQGDFVCASCQLDPMEILQRLLQLARSGDQAVLAIQGYTIVRELGRGGMGAVYLARHDRTGEQVALKVMLPRVAADEGAKASFLRETENTKALKHCHVAELRDYGCSDGTFFFTLEFCDGGSVDRLMARRGGPLPIAEAGPIILQALEGLDYAHHAEIPCVKREDGSVGRGRGLVHRDIKPQNIFLSGSGSSRIAKVADFGLAKAFDNAGLSGLTRTGTAAGTPEFMPRKQVARYKYAKPDVDVWAMAATLYCMLTGAVPRDFPAQRDRWQVVLQNAPVPIRDRNPSIPRPLAEVIDAALVDEPDIRVKSAAELKRALERVL